MSPDLDKKLCDTYPELYQQRHDPPHTTNMCWGFTCGDGWYALIDMVSAELTKPLRIAQRDLADALAKGDASPDKLRRLHSALDEELRTLPIARQVKEKFGALCFYVDYRGSGYDNDMTTALLHFATAMSRRICEYCGTTTDASTHIRPTTGGVGGYIRTLCPCCADKDGYVPFDGVYHL